MRFKMRRACRARLVDRSLVIASPYNAVVKKRAVVTKPMATATPWEKVGKRRNKKPPRTISDGRTKTARLTLVCSLDELGLAWLRSSWSVPMQVVTIRSATNPQTKGGLITRETPSPIVTKATMLTRRSCTDTDLSPSLKLLARIILTRMAG